MKVVYNACFGGFSLSDEGIRRYFEIKGVKLYEETDEENSWMGINFYTKPPESRKNDGDGYVSGYRDFERNDPVLVQVVEELGAKAGGDHAKLAIRNVPAGVKYRIDEYDGAESVMTPDDYQWEIAS